MADEGFVFFGKNQYSSPMIRPVDTTKSTLRYIDLFCGLGGFRLGVELASKDLGLAAKCVFSSDIDSYARQAYLANFGEEPGGDITKVDERTIPDHDLLLAGFPCQPFSIIGDRKGFADVRGTLFFDIHRILEEKRPSFFVLENVKMLVGHDGGRTLQVILKNLRDLEYAVDFKVLNALNFGLPQKRERTWIVGRLDGREIQWPSPLKKMTPLSRILEKNVHKRWYASDYIQRKRMKVMKPAKEPTIWHENKAGHVSAYPYSCALRAGASYNYLLVNGKRRLTTREMLRLQGFPNSFKIACTDSQTRKQAGNSLPVNVAKEVIHTLLGS